MKYLCHTCLSLCLGTALLLTTMSSNAQERDINGARNSSTDGTSLDTNVSFTLRMTLAGADTPLDSATLGEDVSVTAIIRPESEDIGQPTDVILVDYLPPSLNMRNADGNFVSWNGSLKTLVPYLEDVTLESELDVEVFSGQLGSTGNHRIFVGFTVGDTLYFTPSALRFDIEEPVVEASALEQARELFESTISPTIVQTRCIACHVANGAADGGAQHIFVRTSNSNHLTINFDEFEQVRSANGSKYILDKAQGMLAHGGGLQLTSGSTGFNDLSDFLDLLDQAAE
jgi:hypothetical protein